MIAEGDRHFNRVVGIDLGGGKGKNTAVAVGQVRSNGAGSGLEIVSYGTRTPGGSPWYDSELIPFLMGQPEGTLVAIDAPLGLPSCLRCPESVCPGLSACADPAVRWMEEVGVAMEREKRPRTNRRKPMITPYTQRVTEILLRCEHSIQPRETLGQGMGPLTARATHLRRAIGRRFRRDQNLLEVYPKATIHQLAGQEHASGYKRRPETWRLRAEILERFAEQLTFKTWREESLRCDHSFDAVICSYTGYLWATDRWTRDPKYDGIAALEGWIWFPHRNGKTPS